MTQSKGLRVQGDCEEAAILEPLRRHIQIRKAEGADGEDILYEIWKWWDDGDRLRRLHEALDRVVVPVPLVAQEPE